MPMPELAREMTRAEFMNQERKAFMRFMRDAPETTLGWSVTYRCDCGHVDRTPSGAWSHDQACDGTGTKPAGQQVLFGDLSPAM